MTRRKKMLQQLDNDIREHIEHETQDNIDRGMTPEEAHYAALRKFGNVARVKEQTHEVWMITWLEQLWQDVRFGVRALRTQPEPHRCRGACHRSRRGHQRRHLFRAQRAGAAPAADSSRQRDTQRQPGSPFSGQRPTLHQ